MTHVWKPGPQFHTIIFSDWGKSLHQFPLNPFPALYRISHFNHDSAHWPISFLLTGQCFYTVHKRFISILIWMITEAVVDSYSPFIVFLFLKTNDSRAKDNEGPSV